MEEERKQALKHEKEDATMTDITEFKETTVSPKRVAAEQRKIEREQKLQEKWIIEQKKKLDKKKETQEEETLRLESRLRPILLGLDRRHYKYWYFKAKSIDNKILVESPSNEWRMYSTKADVDTLIAFLNPKGIRECKLKKNVEKYYNPIMAKMTKTELYRDRERLRSQTKKELTKCSNDVIEHQRAQLLILVEYVKDKSTKKEYEQKIEENSSLLHGLSIAHNLEPLISTNWEKYEREIWIDSVEKAKTHLTSSKVALILQSLLDSVQG